MSVLVGLPREPPGPGRAHALERGIIIADTKFEFAVDDDGEVVLIDEVLTPDSSRFWPVDEYVPGTSPPSFDKQYVRDYLETLDWDKRPPAPPLPEVVRLRTAEKYLDAENINCTAKEMREAAEGHFTTEAQMWNQDSRILDSGKVA